MTPTPEETPALSAAVAAEMEQQVADLLALRRLSIQQRFAIKRGEDDRAGVLRERVSRDAHATLRLTNGLAGGAPSGDARRQRTGAAPTSPRAAASAPDDDPERS